MACETRETMIDGVRWSTLQLSATRALALESRLLPAVAQLVAPLVGVIGKSAEIQAERISIAFSSLSRSLPPEDFAATVRELCSEAIRDGKKVDFDADFSGSAGILLRYRVAWFVLEANYADFFGALLPEGALDKAKAMVSGQSAGAAVAAG